MTASSSGCVRSKLADQGFPDPKRAVGHQLGTSGHQTGDSGREKTLGNVGIPRVFFVAGAGFEPATFGL